MRGIPSPIIALMRPAPIITSLDWDCDPRSVAARWPADWPLLWLHSGRVHRRWARWSTMASPCAVFRFQQGRSRVDGNLPDDVALTHDPLRDLDAVLASTSLNPHDLPPANPRLPFQGGWIGNISYDLGRVIEPRAAHQVTAGPVDRGWPLIELAWCPEALVFDHVNCQWTAIGHSAAVQWIRWRDTTALEGTPCRLDDIETEIAPREYERMVARTIEYIVAGDIFQANIAQRFHAGFDGSTRALALAAFERAQPWYGAYLESLGSGRRLLSLSPELFLQTGPPPHSRRIITRPIKGTRPASSNARELRDSTKDQAELNMIVDLMRNDLGRVCEFGSVRVPHPRLIETHPTVHHGVAEITGTLRDGTSAGDILRATFPPGSVTGAPKIRAMQIIDELESNMRGPYCGAIGFISDCGAMTLNVAIRTLLLEGRRDDSDRCDVLHDGTVSYSAGAGIVADSIPARELQETLDKAAVLRELAPRQCAASVDAATSAPA
ncbi:MAG TPA: anthranilate synthase component I family protein [Phycisphaerales bacterium]|nr:anthranilate synthase component I family protein [Phycisphaerales bacterium]